MTDPYNMSQLANATNIVEQIIVLNSMTDQILGLGVYFCLSILLVIGIKSTQPIDVALALGCFMAAILGTLLFILGVVPAYAPIMFGMLSAVGTAMVVLKNKG